MVVDVVVGIVIVDSESGSVVAVDLDVEGTLVLCLVSEVMALRESVD